MHAEVVRGSVANPAAEDEGGKEKDGGNSLVGEEVGQRPVEQGGGECSPGAGGGVDEAAAEAEGEEMYRFFAQAGEGVRPEVRRVFVVHLEDAGLQGELHRGFDLFSTLFRVFLGHEAHREAVFVAADAREDALFVIKMDANHLVATVAVQRF